MSSRSARSLSCITPRATPLRGDNASAWPPASDPLAHSATTARSRWCASARYAIGFARCQTPLGPCQKPLDHPLLASDPTAPIPLIGPGGASLFQVGDATWIAFHIWMGGASGSVGGVRSTLIEQLIWAGDIPEPLAAAAEQ